MKNSLRQGLEERLSVLEVGAMLGVPKTVEQRLRRVLSRLVDEHGLETLIAFTERIRPWGDADLARHLAKPHDDLDRLISQVLEDAEAEAPPP